MSSRIIALQAVATGCNNHFTLFYVMTTHSPRLATLERPLTH